MVDMTLENIQHTFYNVQSTTGIIDHLQIEIALVFFGAPGPF